MRPAFFFLLVVWLMTSSGASLAEVAADDVDQRLDIHFGEHEPYRAFLHDLQGAVATDARPRVAAMVSYPLRTRIEVHTVQLRDVAQFLAHYEELLTPGTRAAIEGQSYEGRFANSRGALIGSGQV
jgi:hypothetical protein